MQARVKKMALPETKLPSTHEYREPPKPPEGWTEQKAAQKRRKAAAQVMQQKRKAGAAAKKAARPCVRKGFHVWTDEERDYLRQQNAAGRSWTELGAEFGVSRGAVRIQATRGKEEEQ